MRKLDWADPDHIDVIERREGVVRVARPSRHRPEDVTAVADSSDLNGYVLTVGDDVREAWKLAEILAPQRRERSMTDERLREEQRATEAPILVMSPAKVINHFGRERFAASFPSDRSSITSGPVDVDATRLAALVEFAELHDRRPDPAGRR